MFEIYICYDFLISVKKVKQEEEEEEKEEYSISYPVFCFLYVYTWLIADYPHWIGSAFQIGRMFVYLLVELEHQCPQIAQLIKVLSE